MTANWIDIVVLSIMALSVVFGLWRGMMSAGFGILAIVVGFFAAKDYAHLLFPVLQDVLDKSPLVRPLSYVGMFIAGLLSVGVIFMLIRTGLKRMDFGGLDAIGGAAFGFLRGFVLSAFLVLVFAAIGISATPSWQTSATVPQIGRAIRLVMSLPFFADYRAWLKFDGQGRPRVVDAGLPDLKPPPQAAQQAAPESAQQTAPESAPKQVQGEETPVPQVYKLGRSDGEPVPATPSVNEELLRGSVSNIEAEWGDEAMSPEKVKALKQFLLLHGAAAVEEGDSESLSEEEWARLRRLLEKN